MVGNRMVRTTFLSLSLLAALFIAPGCTDSGPATMDVTGEWVITQTFSTGDLLVIEMDLTQSGENVVGTSSRGNVQGTISGSAIEFIITDEDIKTFSGTVAGDSMAGTFKENFENSLFREGTWTAVRM